MYAAQILQLETESQILRSKFNAISQESIHNDETMRETQRVYESKIKAAQHEISLMRRQWKKEQERLKAGGAGAGGGKDNEPPASPHPSQPSDLLEVSDLIVLPSINCPD
jgi:hypothetical protein